MQDIKQKLIALKCTAILKGNLSSLPDLETQSERYKYWTPVLYKTFYFCSAVKHFISTHLRSMERVASVPC